MNIFVFVKRVPDTESKIKIAHNEARIIEEGLNFVLNPYDEYAVEEALQIREAKGGTVTVVSVGSDAATTILKKCLAMGADEAVLIKDDNPESYDGLRTARIIVQFLKNKAGDYDLLLFGKQSVGADNAQIPAMVAELMDLPQGNVVTSLEIEGSKGSVLREIEGASEKISFPLPAVVSAQKGLNEPRYETLKGIMAAKKKEIPVISLEELGLDKEAIKPQISVLKMESPPERQAGRKIEGEPQDLAKQLVQFLHEEAKVI
ncbi:MAG: electron transfer flavoprotein subunit beta/FixA family protein [Candidatus Aminicenantes bacterium]|nr:electron transfer flavoprotein subunit beta/FixA family protein [Candidatus Aminicenantes bacterium]